MLLGAVSTFAFGQSNISMSNPAALSVLTNAHNPANYTPTNWIDAPDSLLNGLLDEVSPDSMQVWLEKLETFYTRHTSSDTVSANRGIGAVRRWIHSKFQEFDAQNEDRLEVGYLSFDDIICGVSKHKNVFAILPGLDPGLEEILLVEAHFDSRCENRCDTSCYAPGMEDNGSGTVLVMELARVMSKYAFDRTIVFTTVTAEEQGLVGGSAWALFLTSQNVQFMACFNNDVVGGVICGPTASPPGCPGETLRDSTHTRIFSYSFLEDSSEASEHKNLGRYIKLQQEELVNPVIDVPMDIQLQITEDRGGRGGDHIPFRQSGYRAVRFCSSHEHGNGAGNAGDRQHTITDILGVDTDLPPDGIIDSFFVDVNYLRRNTIMNGINLGLLANSPEIPSPIYTPTLYGIDIELTGIDTTFSTHRVGIRSMGSGTLYFDTVLTFSNTKLLSVSGLDPGKEYYVSVANVNADGTESLFTEEQTLNEVSIGELSPDNGVILGQNYPNPVTYVTTLFIQADGFQSARKADLVFYSQLGAEIDRLPVLLLPGGIHVEYRPKPDFAGSILYALEVDGLRTSTRTMVVNH